MADKSFGVKQVNLIGSSGTPNLTSPNNLNLNAVTVAISTDVTIGGKVNSNLILNTSYSIGIGSTSPTTKLDVSGDARVGLNTSQGVILTDSSGGKWRIIVNTNGTLTTVSV